MAGLRFDIQDNITAELAEKLATVSTKAEHALATQISKDTEPFVPARSKSLVNRSGPRLTDATTVVGNQIIYPGPYARYLYYGKVMVDIKTGKGPMRIVGKDGSEEIRFRKGSKLRPTDRPLNISQSVHPKAQSHWFEASKVENLKKWEQEAAKLVKNGIR